MPVLVQAALLIHDVCNPRVSHAHTSSYLSTVFIKGRMHTRVDSYLWLVYSGTSTRYFHLGVAFSDHAPPALSALVHSVAHVGCARLGIVKLSVYTFQAVHIPAIAAPLMILHCTHGSRKHTARYGTNDRNVQKG